MILIPIRHENMRGRRWPIITFALLGLNILAFLGTHWTIEAQAPERAAIRTHLLFLAAMHPELNIGDKEHKLIDPLEKRYAAVWQQLGSPQRPPADEWDQNIRQVTDRDELQSEMDKLSSEFEENLKSSVVDRYGFVPANPTAVSYLTANFLHGGWLHLIGNMWFLWLAGFILEDNWGRAIYSVFYVLAGAIALQFHGWIYPDSFVPLVGASGAVAALMGAFLVRFPKLKIEMLWYLFFFRVRFKAPALVLLPLWGLMEFFYGSLFGQASGVAHWAHVGGFAFGMIAAVILSRSGLEQKASAAIEEKVSWTADAAVVQATEEMEQGKPDDAIKLLEKHIAIKPDSADAFVILQQAYWRKGDTAGHQNATLRLCQLHLKQQDGEAAWRDYEEFQNTGGQQMPAAVWLELCRYLEGRQNFERAVTEYDKLAKSHPKERPALLALIAAGRISLKRLGRAAEALRYYQAAAASAVPHLDWETNIQNGLKEATAALEKQRVPTH